MSGLTRRVQIAREIANLPVDAALEQLLEARLTVELVAHRIVEAGERFPTDSSPSQYIDGWRAALLYVGYGELPA